MLDQSSVVGIYQDVYVPDSLIAGPSDNLLAKGMTLQAGQVYPRGAVLGIITASSKYTLSVAAAVDGSQVPSVINALDIDATAGDAGGIAYFAGTFASSALILGAGMTLAAIEPVLRGQQINIVDILGGLQ